MQCSYVSAGLTCSPKSIITIVDLLTYSLPFKFMNATTKAIEDIFHGEWENNFLSFFHIYFVFLFEEICLSNNRPTITTTTRYFVAHLISFNFFFLFLSISIFFHSFSFSFLVIGTLFWIKIYFIYFKKKKIKSFYSVLFRRSN